MLAGSAGGGGGGFITTGPLLERRHEHANVSTAAPARAYALELDLYVAHRKWERTQLSDASRSTWRSA
jgi:hypothetical protein